MKNRVKRRGYEDTYFIGIPKHKTIRAIKNCKQLVTKRIGNIDTGWLNRFVLRRAPVSSYVVPHLLHLVISFLFNIWGRPHEGEAFDMSAIAYSKVIAVFTFFIPVSAFAFIELFRTRTQICFPFSIQFNLTALSDIVSRRNFFSCSFILLGELWVF